MRVVSESRHADIVGVDDAVIPESEKKNVDLRGQESRNRPDLSKTFRDELSGNDVTEELR